MAAWRQAKKENDFSILEPFLEQIFQERLEYAEYTAPDRPAFNVLLSEYGSVGYFVSYVLGSAYAAQFRQAMMQEINVDKLLLCGELNPINRWLEEKIWRWGKLFDSDEILTRVCNSSFRPEIYTDYLINKYSDLYSL